MADLSQINILKKIQKYLDKSLSKHIKTRKLPEKLSPKEVEELIKEKEKFIKQFEWGYCGGISALWLYCKWLQTQPKRF